MKYLVNRETKEHKVATPLAESIIKGYPDFKDDWQLVEADDEGWIPWAGRECPLPDDCECEIKTKHMREHSISNRASGWDWAPDNYNAIIAYRPILAEQEPWPATNLTVSEDAVRAINETFRRRADEARLATEHLTHCRNKGCFNDAVGGVYCTEHGPAQAEGTPSVFDRLRNAVEAAKSIPTLLAEIEAMLPPQYRIALREVNLVEQAAEDMTDWRNWKEGDLLECIRPTEFRVKGKLYLLGRDCDGDYGILDDEGDVLHRYKPGGECFNGEYFRFHSRPGKESV